MCLQDGVTECGVWAARMGPEQKTEDGQGSVSSVGTGAVGHTPTLGSEF